MGCRWLVVGSQIANKAIRGLLGFACAVLAWDTVFISGG
jgi:hypothetical protein